MTKLSVNVNKLATLRNSRGKNNPDVVKGALDIIRFGGEGITVHPRPDERHIRRTDVYELRKVVKTVEFNIEGYPDDTFLKMVEEVKPEQCTLVPDPPEAITSNAGWLVEKNQAQLKSVADRLIKAGVRSSVFVDPYTMNDSEYALLKKLGIDRIELYTEHYAQAFDKGDFQKVLQQYKRAAELARDAGLGINAGHDLTAENLIPFIREIPFTDEVSIGHALICDALYDGLEKTVKNYLNSIRSATR